MFLPLLAFAVAFVALIKGKDLSERVRRLESDRDELATKAAVLQRLVERLRTPPTTSAKDVERTATTEERVAAPELMRWPARPMRPRRTTCQKQ